MKKAYKITWISLGSILGVIVITVLIALYLVLTPARLTSLVNKYASNFITCDYKIGKVELTLFKTFPDVGLEIKDLVLINPSKGWTSDTVVSVDNCTVSLNIKKLLFEDAIVVNSCQLNNGYVNVFYDLEGKSNLDIFKEDDKEEEEDNTSYSIDLNKLTLNNVRMNYTDLAENTIAAIDGLNLEMKGVIMDDIAADVKLSARSVAAEINDSTIMRLAAQNMTFDGSLNIKGSDIFTDAAITSSQFDFYMRDEIDTIETYFTDLDLVYKGDIKNYETLNGYTDAKTSSGTVIMDSDVYLKDASLALNSEIQLDINKYAFMFGMLNNALNNPFDLDLTKFNATLNKSHARFNNIDIDFLGEFSMTDDYIFDIFVKTETVPVKDLLEIIPPFMAEEYLEGISLDGMAKVNAHIKGVYNDDSMPAVLADVVLTEGSFDMAEILPAPLTNMNSTFLANIDMNDKSDISFRSFSADMQNSKFNLKGDIKDLFEKMICNLNIKANVDLQDIKPFMPDDIVADGKVAADINFVGNMEQIENLDLMKTKINGSLNLKDLNLLYSGMMKVNSKQLDVDFVLPNPNKKSMRNGLAYVKLKGSDIDANIPEIAKCLLEDFNIEAQISNILDENDMTAAIADFSFKTIDFGTDQIVFKSDNTTGSAFMLPSTNDGNISYAAVYSSDSLVCSYEDMSFATEGLSLDVFADYDDREEDMFLQWNPSVNIDLSNAAFSMDALPEQVLIPNVDLKYDESGLDIANSQFILGNSDFDLDGKLTNLYSHLKDGELLKGEFTFTSNYTDVNELMDIFNGMGMDEADVIAASDSTAYVKEDEPFMVPYGVDIVLHTLINNAQAGEMQIRNVGGDLTVKDGILVLQEMGFTSDAAKMQLTALYKSKRKNHLYVGFDFHLLDIDIAEMIKMMPDLDTIVPMLKSFAGNAEFHFAAETNLKSDYSLKYSTLKAACSIEGTDLVVLDSETFNKIKRLLMFNKKTTNKIDSLDVQFTVYKNEIDVYPFSVTMDKYSAMLYGRHNLDMSYDYNIAVLSPPILNRLGLEIKGNDFDNMKYKVRRNRHRNMFKPEKRDYKEEKIAEIKKIISNSLKENVKP